MLCCKFVRMSCPFVHYTYYYCLCKTLTVAHDYVSELFPVALHSELQASSQLWMCMSLCTDDIVSLAMLTKHSWRVLKLVERTGNDALVLEQMSSSLSMNCATSQLSCCCEWSSMDWEFSLESVLAEWCVLLNQCTNIVNGGLPILKEQMWEMKVTMDSALSVMWKTC